MLLSTLCRYVHVPAQRLEVVHMASAATAPPPPASLKRIVAASLIGTTIQ
ncbi:hypothetical protein ACFVYG_05155 [Streptomyces sp. NPDC058256]